MATNNCIMLFFSQLVVMCIFSSKCHTCSGTETKLLPANRALSLFNNVGNHQRFKEIPLSSGVLVLKRKLIHGDKKDIPCKWHGIS